MIVYSGDKSSFMHSVENDTIAIEIEEMIHSLMGRKTPMSEFRSWENSLTYMYKVLNVEDIPSDAGIAIEYNIPQTSKRVDFLISGFDEKNTPGVTIIELKQWDELKSIKEYIVKKSVWCIGGDGWAYDIGYGGIDHVLATGDDINILVLDTEVYSNTGGQASKSTNLGTLAEFADTGKKTNKKDLARMCMSIPNCYVACVSMANPNQVIRALKEASEYNGPSIVIAYSVCISHGIKGGMANSYEIERLALESGYFPTFRYHPIEGYKFDSKNVDFDKYRKFVDSQTRFNLISKNQTAAVFCLCNRQTYNSSQI